MQVANAERIMDGYVKWWRDGVSLVQEESAVRIVLPMLDRHNDHMSIYMAEDPHGSGFVITDLGDTIGDLLSCGCDILGSPSRNAKLDMVVKGFGLRRDGDELYQIASEETLFQSINMLMQGMASVDDMFFTMKDSAKSFFLEDIDLWLTSHDIRYSRDVSISGSTGYMSKIDFLIPKSSRAPERYIKTSGSARQSSIKNALFGIADLKRGGHGDAVSYLFVNSYDEHGKPAPIDSTVRQAADSWDTKAVAWPYDADSVVPEIAA